MIPFPDKKYQIIYADPPWNISYFKETKQGFNNYNLPYPTMTDEDIIDLPVKDLTDINTILFLWCIDSRIPILNKLMESWGFVFKTVGFVWNKSRKDYMGINATIGKYTRKSCEFVYIGSKGKCLAKNHTQNQYIFQPKGEHSKKPDCVRELIIGMCGKLPRIELFARQKVEGWDCWGNEV